MVLVAYYQNRIKQKQKDVTLLKASLGNKLKANMNKFPGSFVFV